MLSPHHTKQLITTPARTAGVIFTFGCAGLFSLVKHLYNKFLIWLSDQCGAEITGKNIALAVTGLAAATLLIVAWGFLIAVVFTPHF